MSLLPEINQASAEINKFVAQANIHQTIAPVDPAAFTDPADTALLASRDPVIREVSVGMTGEAYSDYTVSGTPPLSLPNSIGKPLKAWSVDLLPYQEGSGDPSPSNVRAIHGTNQISFVTAGKNLYNMALQVTDSSNSFYGFAPINNTDYTFTVGIVSRGIYVAYSDDELMPNLTSNNWTWLTSKYNNTTISFNSGTHKWVRLTIYMVDGLVDTTYQLEYGSTSTDYTPYVAPSTTDIPLPQTVYTGTIGSEGGESRSVYALLNDPDKWGVSTGSTLTFQYFQEFRDRATYPNDSYTGLNCTYVPIVRYSRFTGRWNGATQYYFGIYDSDNTLTLDQIKADAVAGKIAICYDLATPTTFALPSVTIPTPTGTATTWATAEDGTVDEMEVTYIKSE